VSWRFARRPSWIARHVLVVALVATMIGFGLWQLRRLDERREQNALISARMDEAPAAVADLVPAGAAIGSEEIEAVRHRPVVAEGRYRHDDSVVVDNRSYNGAPGGWVLTPLLLDGGGAVVVNRGFIGFTREGTLVPPAPPEGTVTVEGLVYPSQQRGRFGGADPAEGRLEVLARADIGRLAQQLDYEVLPALVQLRASDPAELPAGPEEPALIPLPDPTLDDGPHLSYAVQWFIFSTIGIVGYPLILRRVAEQEARERAAGGGEGPPPGAGDDDLDRELAELLRAEG
jgi:surfeit locus 1 family protein